MDNAEGNIHAAYAHCRNHCTFIPDCGGGPVSYVKSEKPSRIKSDHLVILHTNDLHGHVFGWTGWEGDLRNKDIGGMDRLATVVAGAREEVGNDSVLLFDAGDATGDTLLAANSDGWAIFKILEDMGYNALSPGNHEYDFTVQTLVQRGKEFAIQILAANLLYSETKEPVFDPFHIFESGGRKIAVLGLTYPKTPLTTAVKNVQGVEFVQDSRAAVERFLPELHLRKPDLVIILSHLGLKADMELAKSLTGIDLVIGGHSHNRLPRPLEVNGVKIVQAGAHGSDVGRIDIQFDGDKSPTIAYRLLLIDPSIQSDGKTLQKLKQLQDVFTPEGKVIVARTAHPIERAQTLAPETPEKRDSQSAVDSLFADIIRETLKTDIALLPGVGYGVALPAGEVTVEDLKNMIPHDSRLYTMRLTGQQIREILEQSVQNVISEDVENKVGGMIQVSGVVFFYNPKQPFGKRVEYIKVQNCAVESSSSYSVATNSLLAHGGHNYQTFLDALERTELPMTQYEIVRKALSTKKVIVAPQDERIFRGKP